MRRGTADRGFVLSFPPFTGAVKWLVAINLAVYLLRLLLEATGLAPLAAAITGVLQLVPVDVLHGKIWQLATYAFVHAGFLHFLFNMLALWMFGAQLEQKWGTRYFLKFYFVTGIGAGVLTVLFSLLPFGFAQQLHGSNIIGASGAIYGLLLAYALYFPDRPILLIVFWVPARICVAILGAIALFSSLSDAGGVANATHLGGLLVGYLFLKSARIHPLSELKYRYLKWKINRVRKKFDVYSGGRADDWDRHVH